ncbi:extracellular solute-binding protein [Streptomyces sp. SID3343]|uniref:ABC transporter substrate-binding protein n=1 Tax=Streptomyces sp. SID3343 TaxID=2690260 RepID=UPI001367EAB5|nr:extracellular solute-binding protein [Streptomyces sp. SID3343]MYW03725.1 extracellular solute-binding protein [Streptomyces sp. SID3343]
MKRHQMALAATGLSAALLLSACGGSDDKDDDKASSPSDAPAGAPKDGTIKLVVADYGSGDGSQQKYWDGVIQSFNAKVPGVKVNLQVINWDDIDKQVATMIQNNDMPDLLQTGGYADKVVDDLLYPVDEVMSSATKADFVDSFTPAATVKGKQYGIPFTSSTRQLIYNTDLFAKAGLTEPPKTWDEVKSFSEKLKNAGVKVPYGLPLGKEEAQGEFMNWMLGNGGGYKTGDKYTVNSPANVEALNWVNDNLVKTGLTESNPGTKSRKDVFTDFYGGNVGMLNSHPTMIATLKKDYPNVKYATAVIPGKTGPQADTLGVCDWMMAFKKNGHKDQIKAFLDHAFSTDQQLKFQEQYSFPPVTKSVMAKMTANPANAGLKPYIDLLPKAKFYPLNDVAWDVISPKIKEQLGSAVSGQSPKDVLDQLQKEAESAVSQQKS